MIAWRYGRVDVFGWMVVRVAVRVRVRVSVQLADFAHTRLFAAPFIVTISIDIFIATYALTLGCQIVVRDATNRNSNADPNLDYNPDLNTTADPNHNPEPFSYSSLSTCSSATSTERNSGGWVWVRACVLVG